MYVLSAKYSFPEACPSRKFPCISVNRVCRVRLVRRSTWQDHLLSRLNSFTTLYNLYNMLQMYYHRSPFLFVLFAMIFVSYSVLEPSHAINTNEMPVCRDSIASFSNEVPIVTSLFLYIYATERSCQWKNGDEQSVQF